jgi:hypothetical protein
VGFEPTEAFTSHAFEACPFGRSGTLPFSNLPGTVGRNDELKLSGVGHRRRPSSGRHGRRDSRTHVPPCATRAGQGVENMLKLGKSWVDRPLVISVDLFAGEPAEARPAWKVIDAARRAHVTGELTLPTATPVRVYLRDGVVYFAERATDGTVGVRLVLEGVLTRQQLAAGTIVVNGYEHLGRLFELADSVDRSAVELCIELFTDDVLMHVANEVVDSHLLAMYKRHSSGVDRWYPHVTRVVTRVSETLPAGVKLDGDQVAAAGVARSESVRDRFADGSEQTVGVTREPTPGSGSEHLPRRSGVSVVTRGVPTEVIPLVSADLHVAPSAAASQPLFAPTATIDAAVQAGHDPVAQAAYSADADFDDTNVHSDLAEAVRRALAAIEAAGEPFPGVDPDQFISGDWVLSSS